MQDEETTTVEPLPETETQPSAPAPGSEPAVSKVEGLTLDELKATLGKDFPTKEAALKSIKDTYKAVVSKPAPQIDPAQFVSKSEFEQATFYAANPEYKPHQELISALAAQSGKPLSEVVQMDSFKTVYQKVKAADEFEASKSVLHTNPRLGQVTDKMTQVQEFKAKGDFDSGRNIAVQSVLEAYEK